MDSTRDSERTAEDGGGGADLTFFPLVTESYKLSFEVKASSDVQIRLTQSEYPSPNDVAYEIGIGEGENKYCAIRRPPDNMFLAFCEADKILCDSQFRGFWISIVSGTVSVGKSGNSEPFLVWKDPYPISVNFFAFNTSGGSTGIWKFPDQFSCYDYYEKPGDFEYEDFFPLPTAENGSSVLEFEVKSIVPAVVSLQSTPDTDADFGYELVLGADDNMDSRFFKNKELVHAIEVEGILSGDQFRSFRVEISLEEDEEDSQLFQVFRNNEPSPFMEFTDSLPLKVNCFSFQNAIPAPIYRGFVTQVSGFSTYKIPGPNKNEDFYPLPTNPENGSLLFEFQVFAQNDAGIVMKEHPDSGVESTYELMIGCNENEDSRLLWNSDVVAYAETPGILSTGRNLNVWISIKGDLFQVGFHDKDVPVLEFLNPAIPKFNVFSFNCSPDATYRYNFTGGNGPERMLKTSDYCVQKFFKLLKHEGFAVGFKVKTERDATFILCNTSSVACNENGYEIAIGGCTDAQCAFELKRGGTTLATSSVPYIVDGNGFQEYWIKMVDGIISIGRGESAQPFLKFQDIQPCPVKYFAVRGLSEVDDMAFEDPYPAGNAADVETPEVWSTASSNIIDLSSSSATDQISNGSTDLLVLDEENGEACPWNNTDQQISRLLANGHLKSDESRREETVQGTCDETVVKTVDDMLSSERIGLEEANDSSLLSWVNCSMPPGSLSPSEVLNSTAINDELLVSTDGHGVSGVSEISEGNNTIQISSDSSSSDESTDQVNEANTDQLDEVSADQSNEASADQSNEASADQSNEASADQSNEASADQSNEASADQSNEASADQSNEASADQSNEASADQSNEASADQSNEASADQSNEASADQSDGTTIGQQSITTASLSSETCSFCIGEARAGTSDGLSASATGPPAAWNAWSSPDVASDDVKLSRRTLYQRHLVSSMTQTDDDMEEEDEEAGIANMQDEHEETIEELLSLQDTYATMLDEVLTESKADEVQAVQEECTQILEEVLITCKNERIEEEEKIKQRQMCIVCWERERCRLFVPCGHFVCCKECSDELKNFSNECPYCRRALERIENVFW